MISLQKVLTKSFFWNMIKKEMAVKRDSIHRILFTEKELIGARFQQRICRTCLGAPHESAAYLALTENE